MSDEPKTTLPEEDQPKAPEAPPSGERRGPLTGHRLRRILDEDIDAEIEAAMGAFDQKATLAEPVGSDLGDPTKERRTVRVLSVRGEDVFVDLGLRSEGVVPALQFEGSVPAPGSLIEVVVDHYDSDNDLYVVRRPGAAQEADWSSLTKGTIVDAHVRKVNKGGLEVTAGGIRGFMPAGQADIDHIPDLSVLVGQVLRCEVTEANLASRNLVVSRRIVLEREREEKAKATLASLQEGQVLDGVVRRLTDFGAFVDIGGVDGLIHISQMSWQRVRHPGDVLAVGQPVKVVVLKFEPETKKISLGLRQLTESPWVRAPLNYAAGSLHQGTVTKLMEFGAFVELEPGVEGLVHISELSRKRVTRVADVVRSGQEVTVKVLDVDGEKQRISLSMKQAEPEPTMEGAPSAADAPAPEPEPVAKKKKPSAPLKGGLGGAGGPLFR